MKFYDFAKSGYYIPCCIAVGAVIGAGVGIAVDRFARKKEEIPDTTIDLQEYQEITYPKIPDGVNEKNVGRNVNGEWVKEDFPVDKSSFSIPKQDYTKYFKMAQGYSEDGEVAGDGIEDTDYIEIIDKDEFIGQVGNDGYASVTCGYSTVDHILLGWDSEMLPRNIEDTVGWRAIRMFDEDGVKEVYVKNKIVKMLYEIVRYDDPVEAILEDDPNDEQ